MQDLQRQEAKYRICYISVTMTQAASSHESSSLANCRLLHVSVHCRLILYSPSKKLVLVPVASATAGTHRDSLVLASTTEKLEIHPLVFSRLNRFR